MKKLIINTAVALAVIVCSSALCELRAEDAAPAENSEGAAKSKRKPKKLPEYRIWDQASAVAEAYEQPVVAFIGIQGDKITSKLKMACFGNQACKDLLSKNAVFYMYMIPQAKSKGRGQQNKDAPVKPDFSSIKDSEKAIVGRIAPQEGHLKTPLPTIALLHSGGKVIYRYTPDIDDVSFTSFVNGLKEGFAEGKFPIEITSKVEKVLKDEEKKRAAAEKQKRK